MRHWIPPERADIMVSELLGSWADNELSPECLDIAQGTCLKVAMLMHWRLYPLSNFSLYCHLLSRLISPRYHLQTSKFTHQTYCNKG
jgi:hypothetical protein